MKHVFLQKALTNAPLRVIIKMSHKLNIFLNRVLFSFGGIIPFFLHNLMSSIDLAKAQVPLVVLDYARKRPILLSLCDNNRGLRFSVCIASVVHTFLFFGGSLCPI